MSNTAYLNPFDDDQHEFLVLKNSAGQYSLWPVFADIPDGWHNQFGPAPRSACNDFIEAHWHSINPFAAEAAQ